MSKDYIEIDTSKWVRRTTFEWFKEFSNPTYCFNVKIDISDILAYSKESQTSFFINFLYVISRVNNEIESLRLRYIDNKVLLFDRIDPTFTVKTTDGSFNNAGVMYNADYETFYRSVKDEIARRNGLTDNSQVYNKQVFNVFYSSCITTIDIEGASQPLNTNDKNSLNVPRIFWDKYRIENGKTVLLLSMTVSHILIDGEESSKAIQLVRQYCSNFKDLIK